MSGGSMNYAYVRVLDIAELVQGFEQAGELTPEQRRSYEALRAHLTLVAEAVRMVEWVQSSDVGPGGECEAIEKATRSRVADEYKELVTRTRALRGAVTGYLRWHDGHLGDDYHSSERRPARLVLDKALSEALSAFMPDDERDRAHAAAAMTEPDAGPVSADEAREAAFRFIDRHFGKRDAEGRAVLPHISIPADPKRDDDIRLLAYIEQSEHQLRRRDDAPEATRPSLHQATRALLAAVEERYGDWNYATFPSDPYSAAIIAWLRADCPDAKDKPAPSAEAALGAELQIERARRVDAEARGKAFRDAVMRACKARRAAPGSYPEDDHEAAHHALEAIETALSEFPR